MALTNAERQHVWRERYRSEPRDNAALMAQLAALQARVAQLEAELAGRPQLTPRKLSGRQPAPYAALEQEQDELAERLARIAAFAPGIEAEAAAWIKQVDHVPRRRKSSTRRHHNVIAP